jgi:Helix-turn-helix domain
MVSNVLRSAFQSRPYTETSTEEIGFMQQEMDIAQLCLKFGVSKRTVHGWLRSGKLKAQEIAPDRYLIEEIDLEAFTPRQSRSTARAGASPAPTPIDPGVGGGEGPLAGSLELIALRKEFYELAHQVSELERILEEIFESLTAIPEQIEQVRLTVPLQLDEAGQGNSQSEARVVALEQRVSELERIVEAFTTTQP